MWFYCCSTKFIQKLETCWYLFVHLLDRIEYNLEYMDEMDTRDIMSWLQFECASA